MVQLVLVHTRSRNDTKVEFTVTALWAFPVKAFALIALGLAIAAMGVYVANADDAPGAGVIGMLLMVIGVTLGLRAARNRV